ncbi:hypothetical protein KPATCC21470_1988 [Kitasatospora purpeofusca]
MVRQRGVGNGDRVPFTERGPSCDSAAAPGARPVPLVRVVHRMSEPARTLRA